MRNKCGLVRTSRSNGFLGFILDSFLRWDHINSTSPFMKLQYLLLFPLGGSLVCAQTLLAPNDTMPPMDHTPAYTSTPLPDPQTWVGTPIDWCSSSRQFTQLITNTQTGLVVPRTHQFIQVESGLNYIDYSTGPAGAWRPSEDLIELTPDGGAAALHGPNKVYFSPTPLNSTNGGITIVTRSNLVFGTYPLGVYYVDPTAGKEVLLAPCRV